MATLNLNQSEASMFNAIWTLVSGMDEKIQRALFFELGKKKSFDKDNKKTLSHKEALNLVKSFAIQPSNPIPVDEDGRGALATLKY